MNRPVARLASATLLVITGVITGCAAQGPAGESDVVVRSEPAARMGLRPEYHVFYDALVDYGDWDLIEPYGYVFRPRVDPLVWRPYSYGYWAPTDLYGWVWVSSDPFGWATDHYGRWLYDDYKGWVWVPGVNWGPAWVSWDMNSQYVGWAPLGPPGYDLSKAHVPGGLYLYSPLTQFGNTDVHTRAVTAEQMAPAGRENMKPVVDTIERDGVRIPTGPPLAEVERVTGFTITRARLDDAVPVGTPLDTAKRTNQGSTGAPRDGEAGANNAGVRIEAIRRAAMEAAHAAEQAAAQPDRAPAHIAVVRPFGVPGMKPAAPARPAASAPRDSSAH
ncbi:MAG: DUF6600 domain-containing protein [Candidatus Eisenbacteria bacterium]